MKKIGVIILITGLLLTGCNSTQNNSKVLTSNENISSHVTNMVVTDYTYNFGNFVYYVSYDPNTKVVMLVNSVAVTGYGSSSNVPDIQVLYGKDLRPMTIDEFKDMVK